MRSVIFVGSLVLLFVMLCMVKCNADPLADYVLHSYTNASYGDSDPHLLLALAEEDEPVELEEPEARTPPVSVESDNRAVAVGYNLLQSPLGYSSKEWFTAIPTILLGADQIFNGGDFTQNVIDEIRGKSEDTEDRTGFDLFGDRDFIAATDGSCLAAAQHSKDITLERGGESGSCTATIYSPED